MPIELIHITDAREFLNKGGGGGGVAGVSSISKLGSGGITGAVTLSEGTNITLTQAGQNIQITATGGLASLPVQDEGSLVVNATALNFVGAGVTASSSGTTAIITIPGGGGGAGGPVLRYRFPSVTIGQTLFTLPWSYVVGSDTLQIFRNGQHLIKTLNYNEIPSNTQFTLTQAIVSTSEEIVALLVTGAQGPQGSGSQGSQGPAGGGGGVQGPQGPAGGGGGGSIAYDLQTGLTVGTTTISLPFTYTPGSHNLMVIRNGKVCSVSLDYTEPTPSSIGNLTPPVVTTTEEFMFWRLA